MKIKKFSKFVAIISVILLFVFAIGVFSACTVTKEYDDSLLDGYYQTHQSVNPAADGN